MEKYVRVIGTCIAIAAITAPAIVYVSIFGWHISTDHDRWKDSGTALAGIYAPVLSIITAAILYKQYVLQTEMENFQRNQIILEDAKASAGFLAARVWKNIGLYQVGNYIHDLSRTDRASLEAQRIDIQHDPHIDPDIKAIMDDWLGIYTSLSSFRDGKEPWSKYRFGVLQRQVLNHVNLEMAIGLDALAYIYGRERNFVFNNTLPPESHPSPQT